MRLRIPTFLFFIILCVDLFSQYNKSTSSNIESYKLNMGYVKSLSNKADFYFGVGNYEKAIEYGEERLQVLEVMQEKDSLQYAICIAELALYYSNIKQYNKAIELANNAIQIMDSFNSHVAELAKIETEDKLSTYYSLIGDYDNSLRLAKNVMNANMNLYGKEDEKYISSKERVASILSRMSNDEESIKIQEEILEYWGKNRDSLKYAITLHDMSLAYAKKGDYEIAINQCKEASSILKKWLGENDEIYWQSLISLSSYYEESGDFKKAIEVCEDYSKICLNTFGPNSIEYAKSLSVCAFNYFHYGDYLKAIDLQNKTIEIQNSHAIKNDIDNAISLSHMGLFNEAIGNMEEAIHYDEQALSILQNFPHTIAYREVNAHMSKCFLLMGNLEKSLSQIQIVLSKIDIETDKDTYYKYIPYLASYYERTNNDSCIVLYEEIFNYEKQTFGESNVRCSITLRNLSYAYRKLGKIRDAIYAQEQALRIDKLIYGEKTVPYAKSVSHLAYLYNMVGEKEKAIKLNDNARKIIKNAIGTNNIEYVSILRSHAHIFVHTPKEIELLEESIKILSKLEGNVVAYIETMCSLAKAYASQKIILKTKDVIKKIETNSKALNYFNSNQKKYVDFLNDVSSCYIFLCDYNEAQKYAYKSLDISCRVYGKKDVKKHEGAIFNLVSCFCATKEVNNAILLLKEYDVINEIKKEVIGNLQVLTSNYRYNYWNIFSPILVNLIPILAYVTKDDRLISQTYDISALITKGILLKMDTELSDLVKLHGDSILQEDYKWYLLNTKKLDDARRGYERDSIINVLVRQEDNLRQALSKKGLFNDFNVSWLDIRDKLNDDDIAVEFITVTTDSVNQANAALLLKKDYSCPKIISLADAPKIKGFVLNEQRDSLYNNIWAPIKDELRDVKNIYFSPAGEFHNIPIEYLHNYDGQYMHELYNIYRLSSTQEILKPTKNQRSNNAVLYGGLNYDSNMALITKNDNPNSSLSSIDRGLRDSLSNRSGFEPLTNTKIEILEINSILKQSKMRSIVFMGDNGNEESFKKLSGRPIDIIHMSTHGMYVNEIGNSSQKSLYSRLLNRDEEQDNCLIDRPLLRSFLVMAGGNQLPRQKYVPDNSEDGILTAQEISRLDLYGVDLVVLSACQSGLGDVDSEGVWGLQRGFKKAGANTILMSLDKVDDEATRILMVEFYRNLMNGKTKHQSLKEAQKHLREVENGKYDDPKYWASFILLDGLN